MKTAEKITYDQLTIIRQAADRLIADHRRLQRDITFLVETEPADHLKLTVKISRKIDEIEDAVAVVFKIYEAQFEADK